MKHSASLLSPSCLEVLPVTDEAAVQDPIDALIEEYASKLRSGSAPPLEEFASSHPNEADELRDLLPTVVAMEEVRRRRQSGANSIAAKIPERIGDFQIVREIGRGGMGIVYEAQERTLKRRVALKILPGRGTMDALRLQRFQREAQAAAQLHHTNIVPVFGSGEEDGLHYFVMQYIEGRSLHQIVEDSKKAALAALAAPVTASTRSEIDAARKRDYFRWAAGVTLQAAEALQYAHSQGIQHRDIKPGNILIDAKDIAWITDFGLAKIAEHDGLTQTGDVIGTLQYMAPECMLRGVYDSRGDIYSLGADAVRNPDGPAASYEHDRGRTDGRNHVRGTGEPAQDRSAHSRRPGNHCVEGRRARAGEALPDRGRAGGRPAPLRRRPPDSRAPSGLRRAHAALVPCCNRTVAALSGVAAVAMLMALVAGWTGYAQTTAALAREGLKSEAARLAELRAQANANAERARPNCMPKPTSRCRSTRLRNMFEQLKVSESQENFQQPWMPEPERTRLPDARRSDGCARPGGISDEPPRDGRSARAQRARRSPRPAAPPFTAVPARRRRPKRVRRNRRREKQPRRRVRKSSAWSRAS